jgi:tetratricopeptide (TPR) repeat protein
MGEGEFALVRQELEVAFGQSETFDYVGDHDVHTTLVDVAALQRDEAAIRVYAPAAEELAIRYGHKLYQGVVCRAWGVAHRLGGEFDQAEDRFNHALSLFTALGTHWQLGRTYFETGELAAARGDKADARANFAQAIAAFEAMRAGPDLARARAALEQLNSNA